MAAIFFFFFRQVVGRFWTANFLVASDELRQWQCTHRAEAAWLPLPPSLHLLAGFCQSFSTSRPQLYLPGWPYNPWFLVRASGLLLGGGANIKQRKLKYEEQPPKKGRAPFECVRRRRLKLSKETSFLTTASKRDGVRSSARGSDTHSRQKCGGGEKKKPPRRQTDLIAPETSTRHECSTLSHWRCFPSVPKKLARLSVRLGFQPTGTAQHQSGVDARGHEVVKSCVVQLLRGKTCAHRFLPAESKLRNHRPRDELYFPFLLLLLLLFQPLRKAFCVDELMSSGPAHSSLSALRFIITFEATPEPKPPRSSPLSDKQRRQRRHLPTLKAVQGKTPTRAAFWEM